MSRISRQPVDAVLIGRLLSKGLTGIPIIESDAVESDQIILMDDPALPSSTLHLPDLAEMVAHPRIAPKIIMVNNCWRQITWPLMLGQVKKELQDHLARIVYEAEVRLGLREPHHSWKRHY